MNELKKSKLEALRAKLKNSFMNADKISAIKGGGLYEGVGEPEFYIGSSNCSTEQA